jgi:hypothetical protein
MYVRSLGHVHVWLCGMYVWCVCGVVGCECKMTLVALYAGSLLCQLWPHYQGRRTEPIWRPCGREATHVLS